MPNLNDDELDALFSALSDRTRRGVLNALTKKEASVSELAKIYNVSLPGMLKHLKVLEKAKLIYFQKDGRVRYCRFESHGFQQADTFISHYKKYWNHQFDKLEEILADELNE